MEMEAGNNNCFIDCKSGGELPVDGGSVDEKLQDNEDGKVVDGGEVVESIRTMEGDEGFRKLVVPAMEGSISSCGSLRSKLRLCVEMSIRNKVSGKEVLEEGDKCSNAEPVMVVIDYPDDMVVAVNAKIHRFDRDVSFPDEVDEGEGNKIRQGWNNENAVLTDQNENKILDSTFVKVPLSSTMIYPIIEEVETSLVLQTGYSNNSKEPSETEEKGKRKSLSGNASLYQTVMGDNDVGVGFGNISAIAKMVDHENCEKESKDQSLAPKVNRGQILSQKLNSSGKLFQSEEITPAERLVKALHVLARYRGVWGIYEDETRIVNHLTYINRLLTTTDKTTVYKTCKEDNYLEVRGLISYFTLEKRFAIRSELLQAFTLLSEKSLTLSSFIFASEVPVVLAREIENGDIASSSTEICAYASYLLQILSTMELSETQCETIGEIFYITLCEMIVTAAKKCFSAMSEMLFELLLHYHKQLGETNLKWKSLDAAAQNRTVIKKIKEKTIDILLTNGQTSEGNQYEESMHGLKEVLGMINDLILCHDTRNLFPDTELDEMLNTLIKNLEGYHFMDFRREALKTVYRILHSIHIKPSGLDKLEQLAIRLLKEEQASGDYDSCYRGVLKKIYKIVSVS